MKVISMYLPQFHRVKENDEWWGEGFTEWTTVKKAEKLVSNHYQPHVPLNNNYYDLLEQNTMKWQADLMKQYGIDGQCFYHYWFKDGRQILEKPAENLLKWKEINMPFCFCWANETWARTWSKINSKNSWANIFEKKTDKNDTGILLEQKYGNEEQWKQHFEYLLPFFQDKRYIRKENKPVFVIYKAALIPCLNEMLDRWNQWAKESGLPGVYVIGANSNQRIDRYLDAVLYHEPQRAIGIIKNEKTDRQGFFTLNYDEVWTEILRFRAKNEKAIYGGFVGYDDTPRRGKNGTIIEGATPQQFQQYLTELIAKNMRKNNDLIFLNAWNEWGEGMYLEPDEKYRYAYLESVKYAKEHYSECLGKYDDNLLKADVHLLNDLETLNAKCERYEGYWRILERWLTLKEENVCLERYFADRKIATVAVYGAGMIGRHLLRELENGKVEVKYAIDRKADTLNVDVKVYSPDEDLPQVDAIIITATYDFVQIKDKLKKRGYMNVISLEEVLTEI